MVQDKAIVTTADQ